MPNDTQLAVQLYTLREYTKTPRDIAATCKKVAEQGWRAVQASALGPIDPKELRKILDDNGLTCCATHRALDVLRDDTQAVIDEHATLGCQYTAVGGYFPKVEDFTEANWRKFIADFNDAAQKLDGSPLSLGYHNHSHEWGRVGEPLASPRAIDLLMDELSPAAWLELDTYWVAHAGGEPSAWIEKAAGRGGRKAGIPCVHLKDLGIRNGREPYMMEVGAGNLEWPAILRACKAAGVEWYIVEQDHCWRDPFESLATSLANLRAMGLK